MKRSLKYRLQITTMLLASGSAAPVLGGCLSDQQATSILQTVITTGLTTLVDAAITQAVSGAAQQG